MNKKLLLIGSSLNYGSPGKITENIGLSAMNNGWTVYQAHGVRYSNKSQLITYPVTSSYGEIFHAALSFLFDAHGLGSVPETKKLIKWIDKIKPDIIHLHNIHGYYLNYKILFEYLSGLDTPIVWTFHDFWPITGHCVHFDYVGCDKWKTECNFCPQISTYPKSLFIDMSKRNFLLKKRLFTSVKNMVIITVSQWVGRLIANSFLNKYKIYTIYNGVNTKLFKPVTNNLREKLNLNGKFVLLGVASPWYPLKGINDYFKLNQCLPNDCQIIMIGLNSHQIATLPSGIIGVERTQNQKELVEYYSMADVVLNLSYQETFGMTTIEGLACGTPSIVYDKTASPELISEKTGKVVQAGNINQLKDAIISLKEENFKIKYTNECRSRALELFDMEKQFASYITLYSSLLKDKR